MAITAGKIVRTALRCIPERYRTQLLMEFAGICNCNRITATGDCGEILGSVADRTIFLTYAHTGKWSQGTTGIISHFLEKAGKSTFIDIGANIGLTSIPAAKLGHVDCILFEPEPQNFSLLTYNMQRNAPPGSYQLHNLALFDTDIELSFELAVANHGDHRVRVGSGQPDSNTFAESTRKVIKVKGSRLDDIVDGTRIAKPLVVKIDTQGAEYNVYKGGRKLLSSADMLITEFWPYGIKRMGGSPEELLKMLAQDFAYGLFFDENEPIEGMSPQPLTELMDKLSSISAEARDMDWQDLVLLKTPSLSFVEQHGGIA